MWGNERSRTNIAASAFCLLEESPFREEERSRVELLFCCVQKLHIFQLRSWIALVAPVHANCWLGTLVWNLRCRSSFSHPWWYGTAEFLRIVFSVVTLGCLNWVLTHITGINPLTLEAGFDCWALCVEQRGDLVFLLDEKSCLVRSWESERNGICWNEWKPAWRNDTCAQRSVCVVEFCPSFNDEREREREERKRRKGRVESVDAWKALV
jgi:hypothetical protein